MKIKAQEIKIGDTITVDRGRLGIWVGKLLSIIAQGWWKYGEIELADGTMRMWDTDVHTIRKLDEALDSNTKRVKKESVEKLEEMKGAVIKGTGKKWLVEDYISRKQAIKAIK